MSRTISPGAAVDRLAELEDERRFLLRSLADLEREHAAGDIDDHDFTTLHDGYTARAATVLRAIGEGRDALPARRPWRRGVAVAVVVATLTAAVIAGWAVARFSGQRDGSPVTGGQIGADGVATMLVEARRRIGVDPALAQRMYDAVLSIEPGNVEAITYRGWILFVLSQAATADVAAIAIEEARTQIETAVDADPTYPDAHCFLGIIAIRTDGEQAAQTEIDLCRANNPPAELEKLVAEELAPATG